VTPPVNAALERGIVVDDAVWSVNTARGGR